MSDRAFKWWGRLLVVLGVLAIACFTIALVLYLRTPVADR